MRIISVIAVSCAWVCVVPIGAFAQQDTTKDKSDIESHKVAPQVLEAWSSKPVANLKLKIGPGMEIVTIDGTNVLVPKGTKVSKNNASIDIEEMGEYIGRNFEEVHNRLATLESQNKSLQEEVDQLKKQIDEITKKDVPVEIQPE